jgi:hypothetical protein
MLTKMEKQIYIKPCLKVFLFDEEPVLGNATYPVNPSGPGEDLSKESTFDNSEFPNLIDNSNFPARFKSVWDED